MEEWESSLEGMARLMAARLIRPGFWRNKTVLVTGHTGFKGAWLCLWLARMGAKVTGVALPPPTKPSLFQTAHVADMLERSVVLDIRDRAKLVHLFCKTKPQIVLHLAAQPLVRDSYKRPVDTYATNVMGTVNVFEAVRSVSSVRAVVNVTTDKCYENIESQRGYRENDPLGGYDPYSSSKACSEIVTAAYRRSFFHPDDYRKHGVAIATARAGNVIGGGDWAEDRLVPDCIRSLIKNENVVLRHPNAVRPWQHVLEPLAGYLSLSERLFSDGKGFGSAWNFGPEKRDVLTVKQMAELICSLWGGKNRVVISAGKHPHEAALLMLDISKVKKRLGWKPRMTLPVAMRETVSWYQAWSNKEDMRDFSLKQIATYMGSREQ